MSSSGIFKLTGLMSLLIRESKETGQELYPVLVRIFLYVAEHDKTGGITQTKIKNDLGIIQTSVYRALAALGEGTSKKPNSGLGLVQAERNPADYRSDILTLTPKGRDFLQKLIASIE